MSITENWDVKGKFPPNLKPILAKVALRAVVLGEYDDNFFNLMPRLFPYNKFTMTVRLSSFCWWILYIVIERATMFYDMQKLIKRTIWRDHTNLLIDRQQEILKQLQDLATAGFAKAKDEWEKSVVAWGMFMCALSFVSSIDINMRAVFFYL